jgi:uncharacterized membrane protein
MNSPGSSIVYLLFKTLHVLAVVMFIGNIATGVFWKAHADTSRDPRIIAHTMRGIIKSDRLFTIPGVFLIILAGVGMAVVGHIPIIRTSWTLAPIILFSISGIAFMAQVAPAQRRIAKLAEKAGTANEMDWTEYERLSRRWAISGWIALLTPLAALIVMVVKP